MTINLKDFETHDRMTWDEIRELGITEDYKSIHNIGF